MFLCRHASNDTAAAFSPCDWRFPRKGTGTPEKYLAPQRTHTWPNFIRPSSERKTAQQYSIRPRLPINTHCKPGREGREIADGHSSENNSSSPWLLSASSQKPNTPGDAAMLYWSSFKARKAKKTLRRAITIRFFYPSRVWNSIRDRFDRRCYICLRCVGSRASSIQANRYQVTS